MSMNDYEKICEDVVESFDKEELKTHIHSITTSYGMAVINNDRSAIIDLSAKVRFAMVMMDIMIDAKRSEIADANEREVHRLKHINNNTKGA